MKLSLIMLVVIIKVINCTVIIPQLGEPVARRLLAAAATDSVFDLFVDKIALEIAVGATGKDLYNATGAKVLRFGVKEIPNDGTSLAELGIGSEANVFSATPSLCLAERIYNFAKANIVNIGNTTNDGLNRLHSCALNGDWNQCKNKQLWEPFVDLVYGADNEYIITMLPAIHNIELKTTLDLSMIPEETKRLNIFDSAAGGQKINTINIGMGPFDDLQLTELMIENHAINNFNNVMQVAQNIKSLRRIALNDNQLTSINLKIFIQSKLEALYVRNNQITEVFYEPQPGQKRDEPIQLFIGGNQLNGNANAARLRELGPYDSNSLSMEEMHLSVWF